MQSVCTLLPHDLAAQVVEARAILAGEPSIGAIYDPPFAHFTLQLAEDYDWHGLQDALSGFAATEEPFEARTLGLLLWGGASDLSVAVLPHLDDRLRDFQSRVWQAVTPFAQGNIRKMDTPGGWIPHVTVKRGGPHREAVARAVSRFIDRSFSWTFEVDNISVQHDPGKNSRTHYQRFVFPLGKASRPSVGAASSNARILALRQEQSGNGETVAEVQLDTGERIEQRWDAPALVNVMAAARSSEGYFAGARCRVEDGRVTAVEPLTPFPIQA